MTPVEKIIRIEEARARRICDEIRANMTSARDLLLELYEGKGWDALGYGSWRECVAAEFGQHEVTLYRQLKAAQVEKELKADPVFANSQKNHPTKVSEHSLATLANAPEGARAEVLDIAIKASGGKPTEKVVRAAVEAKKAAPEATPAELVAAVVEAKPKKKPKAVVPEVVEEVREEKAEQAAKKAELTDEEWLASLPLASKLAGHALDKFRRDALDYRDLETTVPSGVTIRKSLAEFYVRTKKRQKGKVPYQGYTAFRCEHVLGIEHPKSWYSCPDVEKGGCGGTGTVGSIGQCPTCYGRGYLPR